MTDANPKTKKHFYHIKIVPSSAALPTIVCCNRPTLNDIVKDVNKWFNLVLPCNNVLTYWSAWNLFNRPEKSDKLVKDLIEVKKT